MEAEPGPPILKAGFARATANCPTFQQQRPTLSPLRCHPTKWSMTCPHRNRCIPPHTSAFLSQNSSAGFPICEPTNAYLLTGHLKKCCSYLRRLFGGEVCVATSCLWHLLLFPSTRSRWLDRLLEWPNEDGALQSGAPNQQPISGAIFPVARIHGLRNQEKREWLNVIPILRPIL